MYEVVKTNRTQIGSGAPGQPAKERGKKRNNLPPVGKKRAKENRQSDQIHEAFMRYNPYCAWCGQAGGHRHHICNGTAGRAATLFDTDLQLNVCQWDHDTVFNDALAMPDAKQLALKFQTILDKYNRASVKKITMAAVAKYLNLEE